MSFADYFLIVADFIGTEARRRLGGRARFGRRFARRLLLGSRIDPIRYGLLFERSSTQRADMPDMDIDFAVEGRERVINDVAEKYGRERVAQIITSRRWPRGPSSATPAACSRSYGVVDRIAKLFPKARGRRSKMRWRAGAELRKVVDADPVAKEIVDLARPLEGLRAPTRSMRRASSSAPSR